MIITSFSCFINLFAQEVKIKGVVIDEVSNEPIKDVVVSSKKYSYQCTTDKNGFFSLKISLLDGESIILLTKDGYDSKRFKIILGNQKIIDLSTIVLIPSFKSFDAFTISLSDDELDDEEGIISNNSGIFHSSKDVFTRAVAFDFSSVFFRRRGVGSDKGTLLLNGIKMNSFFDGRPQWNNWGGINNALRNQFFVAGSKQNSFSFGNIGGTTNISLKASEYKATSNVSYAASNRTYANRLLLSHSSGLISNGWAFAISLGRRWANESYIDGVMYASNSIFTSVQKIINNRHSVNLVAVYTPNIRGKSPSMSKEVYGLKSNKYNSYWGFQDGKKRNSRVREIKEPFFILNHSWDPSKSINIDTNISYKFGYTGATKLDFNGSNPAPDYYKKMPSYALRNDASQKSLAEAYMLEQNFLDDGQLDWNSMYDANISNPNNAVYILYQDRIDSKQVTANSNFNVDISDKIALNTSFNFSDTKFHNYAKVADLLGAISYVDKDYFSNVDSNAFTPNRIVLEGDEFKYNYNIDATDYNAFFQGQFNSSSLECYFGFSLGNTVYQREGLYLDGHFFNNNSDISSYGKGEKLSFLNLGFKAGFTYKISGKHILDTNIVLTKLAPKIKDSYLNMRQNNLIVPGLTREKTTGLDVSYVFRANLFNAKITTYAYNIENATEMSFFYMDGIASTTDASAFVQEAITGLTKRNVGLEFGAEYKVLPTIKFKSAIAFGQATYGNNPNVFLSSDKFIDKETNPYDNATSFSNGIIDFGTAKLKNYRQAAGPQTALSFGFEYRDPNYWWFGATANYFSNAYVDISAVLRTTNFTLDQDGLPIENYDPTIAKELLKQEKLEDYFLLNFVGGKSFRFGSKYVSFFGSINNVLNQYYITGGYEQSRNGNYTKLLMDSQRASKIFGSKYWFGRGTNYFLNISMRF